VSRTFLVLIAVLIIAFLVEENRGWTLSTEYFIGHDMPDRQIISMRATLKRIHIMRKLEAQQSIKPHVSTAAF